MKKYYWLLITLVLLVISISQLSLVNADGVNQQKESIAQLKLISETQLISILEDSSLKVNLKNIIREGNFFHLIRLVDVDSNKVINIKKSIDRDQLIISPQIDLENGHDYTLHIPPYSLENISGEKINDSYFLKFQIVSNESAQKNLLIETIYESNNLKIMSLNESAKSLPSILRGH